MKRKSIDYLIMTAGITLMTMGIYFFKIPNGFSTGGVSGLSTVLGYVLPFLTPATLMAILNVLLLILGFIVLGKEIGGKTVFCSLLFSAQSALLEWLLPLHKPLTDQPFLELTYATLLTAFGSAILFNQQASSGGTDIVALILKKYTSLDVGRALLCTDALIAASAFFVFGLRIGLFSLLGLFVKAFLVDHVIESINECKCFMIITSNPEPISQYILREMRRSATMIDAQGKYTQESKTVLITLCRRIEAVHLKRKLRGVDPGAFVIVNSTSEIIGRGFRSV